MSGSCCSERDSDDQCAGPDLASGRQTCAACGREGPRVDALTVAAMTRGSVAPKQTYWLCEEPECPTVYHGDAGAVYRVDDMHVIPGFKSAAPESLVCYCFMHTRAEIEREMRSTGETTLPARITAEIKAANCACEVRNPAGRCCLGEVNRAAAEIGARLSEVEA